MNSPTNLLFNATGRRDIPPAGAIFARVAAEEDGGLHERDALATESGRGTPRHGLPAYPWMW